MKLYTGHGYTEAHSAAVIPLLHRNCCLSTAFKGITFKIRGHTASYTGVCEFNTGCPTGSYISVLFQCKKIK